MSDRKIPHTSDNITIDYYTSDITSAQDYYAFGQLMPGRNVSSNEYKFGFNGKEKDDEVKGSGNSYDFGARIYDSRVGRWLSLDPSMKKYPHLSPYNAFENNPIYFKDPDGKDAEYSIVGNTITVSTTIVITGKNATADKALQIQNDIMKTWNNNGKGNTAVIDGKTYNLKFDVTVKTMSQASAKDIKLGNNLVGLSDIDRSKVNGSGYTGEWNTDNKYGNDWSHEFLHILGISDLYVEYYEINSLNEESDKKTEFDKDIDAKTSVFGYGKKVSQEVVDAISKQTVKNQNENGKGVIKARGMPIFRDRKNKIISTIREKTKGSYKLKNN